MPKCTFARVSPSIPRVEGRQTPVPMNTEEYPSRKRLSIIRSPPITTWGRIFTPSSSSRALYRSRMLFGSRKSGIPYWSMPPIRSFSSKIVTPYPFHASSNATVIPAGPLPMTATFFPFQGFFPSVVIRSRYASEMYFSIS